MQRQCSGELYRVLDVAATAAPAEIKKAYRRQALKYHPDKTGGTTTREFQRIEEANSILSNPQRRTLYDQLGREGLNTLERFGMDNMAGQFAANRGAFIALFCFLQFLVLLLLLFFILLCVRMDHDKQWRWVNVFTPIWILVTLLLLLSLPLFYVSVVKNRDFASGATTLSLITFCISLILLASSLDGRTEWKTTWVFIWFTYSISFIQGLVGLLPSNVQKELSMQGVDVSGFKVMSLMYVTRVASSLFASVCTIAFLIQLNLYLTDIAYSQHSFYLTFAPLYIRVCVPVLISFIVSVAIVRHLTIRQALCHAITSLLMSGWSLYMSIMISIKCQRELNNGQSGPSTIVCIFPVFLTLAVLACLLPCLGAQMMPAAGHPGESTPFSGAAAPTPRGEATKEGRGEGEQDTNKNRRTADDIE